MKTNSFDFKLMVMRFLFFVVSLMLLLSCIRSEPNKSGSEATPVYVIGKDSMIIELFERNLIADVEYIPLESTLGGMVGQISKINYHDGRFYFYDQHVNRNLLVFSRQGDFLFKIEKIGHGPGEYSILNGFDLDREGNIYLGDNARKCILKYDKDGKFVDEIETNLYFEEFCCLPDGRFLLHNIYEQGKITVPLGIFTLNDNKPDTIIKRRELLDESKIMRFGSSAFSKNGDVVLYYPRFTNSVLKITNEGIEEYLSIDNAMIPNSNVINKLIQDPFYFRGDTKHLMGISNIFETDDFVYAQLYKNLRTNMVISKNSMKYKYMLSYTSEKYLGENQIYGVAENKMISVVGHLALENNWKERIEKSTLPDDVKTILHGFGIDSNPILCLLRFNDF